VQRRQPTAKRQQAQPRATFKESPLVAGQAVLAQVSQRSVPSAPLA